MLEAAHACFTYRRKSTEKKASSIGYSLVELWFGQRFPHVNDAKFLGNWNKCPLDVQIFLFIFLLPVLLLLRTKGWPERQHSVPHPEDTQWNLLGDEVDCCVTREQIHPQVLEWQWPPEKTVSVWTADSWSYLWKEKRRELTLHNHPPKMSTTRSHACE